MHADAFASFAFLPAVMPMRVERALRLTSAIGVGV